MVRTFMDEWIEKSQELGRLLEKMDYYTDPIEKMQVPGIPYEFSSLAEKMKEAVNVLQGDIFHLESLTYKHTFYTVSKRPLRTLEYTEHHEVSASSRWNAIDKIVKQFPDEDPLVWECTKIRHTWDDPEVNELDDRA